MTIKSFNIAGPLTVGDHLKVKRRISAPPSVSHAYVSPVAAPASIMLDPPRVDAGSSLPHRPPGGQVPKDGCME